MSSGSGTIAAAWPFISRPATASIRSTIVVESIWPNRYWLEGIGINGLIGADAAPPDGGAAFHDTAVWLEPVTGVAGVQTLASVDGHLRRVTAAGCCGMGREACKAMAKDGNGGGHDIGYSPEAQPSP